MNQALSNMLGYVSPAKAIENITDIAQQVYVKTIERTEIVNKTLNDPEIQKFENVYKRKDGKEFTAFLYVKAIRDQAGKVKFLEGMVEDITEKKEKQHALLESEMKCRG
jgi:PAS domain S-box-containing protein